MMTLKVTNLCQKHRNLIRYGIFGVLTTLVNYVVYYSAVNLLHVNYLVSNTVAWLIAVLFAFVTNKRYVFNSRSMKIKVLIREFVFFLFTRVLSGAFETLFLYVFVDLYLFPNGSTKIFAGLFVIVANYFVSKFMIFRKGKERGLD